MSLRSFTYQDLVARNATLYGNRAAFTDEERSLTHAQYAERVAQLAGGLARCGIRAGDRIAALLPNGTLFVEVLGATAHIGAILVPVNTRLSREEVWHVLDDTKPSLVVMSAEFEGLLPDALPEGVSVIRSAGSRPGALSLGDLYEDGADFLPAALSDDAGFLIIHTAAVGGRARGALLTHRGVLGASSFASVAWQLSSADVNVGVLPLFHLAGISLLLAVQQAGGASVLLRSFAAESLVDRILQVQGSVIGTFPPMLAAVTKICVERGESLPSLRVVTGLDSPETIDGFHKACPGASFWAGYGQTETSGIIAMAPASDRIGSAGRPIPVNVLRIVDEEGRSVPAGQVGEIVLKGPMVFGGYWGLAPEQQPSFRAGWHHTGDLGRIDSEGYLWYAGRSPEKELIKSGGENVYPAEVERCLREHPEIEEAVVFGAPDEQWGEIVCAACEPRQGCEPEIADLVDFVASRIARYKRPKQIWLVPSLPRTASQAIDRDAVKRAYSPPPIRSEFTGP